MKINRQSIPRSDYQKFEFSYKLFFLFAAFVLNIPIYICQGQSSTYWGGLNANVNVGENGEATAAIDLDIPKGTNLMPSLTIAYNSQSGDGWLGLGFNLQGAFQAITRVAPTLEQDGFNSGIGFNPNSDRYALNGERLIATFSYSNVTTGYLTNAAITGFRMEQESFSKIIPHISYKSSISKYEADSFTVFTKDGLILEFGYTNDSRITGNEDSTKVESWLLNRVLDRNGNYYIISYSKDYYHKGEFNQIEVKYTGNINTGQMPYCKIILNYVNRQYSTLATKYLSGYSHELAKNLGEILIYDHDTLLTKYKLEYELSYSSQLKKIKRFAANGIDTLQPINFSYAPYSIPTFTSNNWSPINPEYDDSSNGRANLIYDFNGDGLADIIHVKTVYDKKCNILVSNGSRFADNNWNFVGFNLEKSLFADFNGDGKTDIATFVGSGDWEVRLSTGTSFQVLNWNTVVANYNYIFKYTGDFNGDGLSDIACYTQNGDWNIYISTGSGFNPLTWSDGYVGGLGYSLQGDFNGDGKSDFARYDSTNLRYRMIYSTGSNFKSNWWYGPSNINQSHIADINNDGISDFTTVTAYSGEWTAYIMINDSTSTSRVLGFFWPESANDLFEGVIINFDGDRYPDFMTYNGNIYQNINGLQCQHASGMGGCINWLPTDFNGDGITDLLGYKLNVLSFQSRKHEVEEITCGNEIKYHFNYSPITDTSIYKKGTSANYPMMDIQAPFYVVNKMTISAGQNYNEEITYKYENAQMNLRGRGFRGFEKIVINNFLQNTIQTNFYTNNSRSNATRLWQSTTKTTTGVLLKNKYTYNGLQEFSFPTDKSYFSYYSQVNEYTYDLNGVETSGKITNYTYDSYGNVISVTENVSSAPSFSQTTTNTFMNNTVDWLLGKLLTSSITKILSGKPSITKNSSFVYDTKGNLIKETYLPGNAKLQKIRTYTLDAFGNRINITITGSGISSRTDKIIYETDGSFPIQLENAIGKKVRRFYKNGFVIAEKDADSLLTNYERDAFGRITKIIHSDGIVETITYSLCNGSCPPNSYYYIQKHTTGGGGDKITYYDKLDRVVRETSIGFGSNGIINIDKIYNADGTLEKISDPYYSSGSIVNYTSYIYDVIKRVKTETAPGNRITQTSYSGLMLTITNPEGQMKTIIKNKLGELVAVLDANTNALTYEYDSDLNLTKITDSKGNQTLFNYDLLGNKIYMKDPDMGEFFYEYNSLGLMTKQTNAAGQITTFTYDLLNRLKTRSEPEGTSSWIYDPKYGAGQLSAIKFNNQNVETFTYNTVGKLSKHTYFRNGVSKAILYTYNSTSGLLEYVTYPNNVKLKYEYSNNTFLSKITGTKIKATSITLWTARNYDVIGALSQYTLGNGLITTKQFDPLTKYITSIVTGTSLTNDSIQNLTYTYSALGNVTQRKDNKLNLTETFLLDNLNRLTQAQVAGQSPKIAYYDELGNITFKSDVGYYTYGQNGKGPHQLTSINNSGVPNCIYPFNESLTYSSYNYVIKVADSTSEINFTYGPSRERLSMVIKKGNVFKETNNYFGKDYVESADSSGKITYQYFVYANNQVVAVVSGYKPSSNPNLKISYPIYDNLGSVYAYTDSAGRITHRYSYDAWGKLRNPLTWGAYDSLQSIPIFNRGFTSHDMLNMDWLVFMNARIYNPILGRFLSADPFVQFPDNLQSYNRYSYVLNNPLTFADPSGFGIGHWISNAFQQVTNVVQQVISTVTHTIQQNAGTIVTIAIIAGTGGVGGYVGAFMTGSTAGFWGAATNALVHGGGVVDAFHAGIRGQIWGGISAGLTYGIGHSLPSWMNTANGNWSTTERVFSQFGNSLSRSIVSGLVATQNGGAFSKSFYNGMMWESIQFANELALSNFSNVTDPNEFSKGSTTWEKGNGAPPHYDDSNPWGKLECFSCNNIGTDLRKNMSVGTFSANEPFSNFMNNIPGMHNHANVHDTYMTILFENLNITNHRVQLVPDIISQVPFIYMNYGVLINHSGILNSFQQSKK